MKCTKEFTGSLKQVHEFPSCEARAPTMLVKQEAPVLNQVSKEGLNQSPARLRGAGGLGTRKEQTGSQSLGKRQRTLAESELGAKKPKAVTSTVTVAPAKTASAPKEAVGVVKGPTKGLPKTSLLPKGEQGSQEPSNSPSNPEGARAAALRNKMKEQGGPVLPPNVWPKDRIEAMKGKLEALLKKEGKASPAAWRNQPNDQEEEQPNDNPRPITGPQTQQLAGGGPSTVQQLGQSQGGSPSQGGSSGVGKEGEQEPSPSNWGDGAPPGRPGWGRQILGKVMLSADAVWSGKVEVQGHPVPNLAAYMNSRIQNKRVLEAIVSMPPVLVPDPGLWEEYVVPRLPKTRTWAVPGDAWGFFLPSEQASEDEEAALNHLHAHLMETKSILLVALPSVHLFLLPSGQLTEGSQDLNGQVFLWGMFAKLSNKNPGTQQQPATAPTTAATKAQATSPLPAAPATARAVAPPAVPQSTGPNPAEAQATISLPAKPSGVSPATAPAVAPAVVSRSTGPDVATPPIPAVAHATNCPPARPRSTTPTVAQGTGPTGPNHATRPIAAEALVKTPLPATTLAPVTPAVAAATASLATEPHKTTSPRPATAPELPPKATASVKATAPVVPSNTPAKTDASGPPPPSLDQEPKAPPLQATNPPPTIIPPLPPPPPTPPRKTLAPSLGALDLPPGFGRQQVPEVSPHKGSPKEEVLPPCLTPKGVPEKETSIAEVEMEIEGSLGGVYDGPPGFNPPGGATSDAPGKEAPEVEDASSALKQVFQGLQICLWGDHTKHPMYSDTLSQVKARGGVIDQEIQTANIDLVIVEENALADLKYNPKAKLQLNALLVDHGVRFVKSLDYLQECCKQGVLLDPAVKGHQILSAGGLLLACHELYLSADGIVDSLLYVMDMLDDCVPKWGMPGQQKPWKLALKNSCFQEIIAMAEDPNSANDTMRGRARTAEAAIRKAISDGRVVPITASEVTEVSRRAGALPHEVATAIYLQDKYQTSIRDVVVVCDNGQMADWRDKQTRVQVVNLGELLNYAACHLNQSDHPRAQVGPYQNQTMSKPDEPSLASKPAARQGSARTPESKATAPKRPSETDRPRTTPDKRRKLSTDHHNTPRKESSQPRSRSHDRGERAHESQRHLSLERHRGDHPRHREGHPRGRSRERHKDRRGGDRERSDRREAERGRREPERERRGKSREDGSRGKRERDREEHRHHSHGSSKAEKIPAVRASREPGELKEKDAGAETSGTDKRSAGLGASGNVKEVLVKKEEEVLQENIFTPLTAQQAPLEGQPLKELKLFGTSIVMDPPKDESGFRLLDVTEEAPNEAGEEVSEDDENPGYEEVMPDISLDLNL